MSLDHVKSNLCSVILPTSTVAIFSAKTISELETATQVCLLNVFKLFGSEFKVRVLVDALLEKIHPSLEKIFRNEMTDLVKTCQKYF